MLGRLILILPFLSVALFAAATPLEARDPAPGLIEDLLKGTLNPLGQLIKDILAGVKSGISDEIENKPVLCLTACCKCNVYSSAFSGTVNSE
jgi:L-ascorbate peroxidase